ncbi:hypothetical protein Sjap_022668 [Stephania japonica]|uniref:Mediator of RNA polymerase II transcription subunit 4 n=1 Tax=Stephania japonica TaxID=461633 RepID=A0AAP0HUL8_9MAGN
MSKATMLHKHPSQMIPSPARLGLTNPNSPSLSNPTTPRIQAQPQPQPQPPPPTATPTVSAAASSASAASSSSLLSLLPPLSRAQSLLLQMASLASKLFDLSPNRSHWVSSFRGSPPTFLPSSSPAPSPQDSPSSIKDLLSLFTSLQTLLFESVAQLQEILDLQDLHLNLSRQISSLDTSLLTFAANIKDVERLLDLLLDDYSHYRPAKRFKGLCSAAGTVAGNSLALSHILSYAHTISYTTFAPPEFGAGHAPLRGALPPAPQDEHMRASQLYNFAHLDVGLPKVVRGEEDKGGVDSLIEAAAEGNQLVDFAAIPPQLTVPSGWRPGMPVEFPTDLPILPPPGWKPGDPVPLPPLDALLPINNDEMQHRPLAPLPPKGPDPIQVRFVQLDINPDQDDYSTDYSSEVGSSEDDDED